ncbi:MAG: HAMP domain-containing sensor histidine kinase [Bdellovibrionia bacterium]
MNTSEFENARRTQLSEVAFWLCGPIAIIIVILCSLVDYRLYPDAWGPMFYLPRFLVVIPSIATAFLLRFKSKLSPDFISMIVPAYVISFHCYFITKTGFATSEYHNAIIQTLFVMAIAPFRPKHFLLTCVMASALYCFTLTVLGTCSAAEFIELRHLPISAVYLCLGLILSYTLHRMRLAVFNSSKELADELNFREQKIQHLLAKEIGSQHLQAKAQLAGQVAHDLRSPLGALKVGVAKIKTGDPEVLDLLRSSVSRIIGISDTLLAQHRTSEQLRPSNISLRSMIETVIEEKLALHSDLNRLTFRARYRSTFHDQDFPAQMGQELMRIFSNLIDNSIEATRGNTLINIRVIQTVQATIIRIRDNGMGFAPGLLNRILLGDSFGKGRSRGLGVESASKKLRGVGGSLLLKSTPGKGTVVTLFLPPPNPANSKSKDAQRIA